MVLVVASFAVTLMVGKTFYPPSDVLRVMLGESVPGASFTVGRLRLPRAVLAVVAGICFGLGGITFQTMLRNPLASPDIIGISSGASAAAAFAIISLSLGGSQVSVFAIAVGLGVAVLIYVLSFRDGVAGTRLILIGIGIAAMLDSVTAYLLSTAAAWDLQEAMRWLTGSLNGANWGSTVPVLLAVVVLGPVLLSQSRNLSTIQLGDDAAQALGRQSGTNAHSDDHCGRRTHRLCHCRCGAHRLRRISVRAHRRPHRRSGNITFDSVGAGRSAAGASCRFLRTVRLRHPLPPLAW